MINNEDQNQQQSQEMEIELLQRQGRSQEMMEFVANIDITHPSSDNGRRRGGENNNFDSSIELDEGEDADSLSNEEREDLSNTYLARRQERDRRRLER